MLLAPADARALLRRYHQQGDAAAREELVEAWLPSVRRIARRFDGRGEPLEDLVQVGVVGLIKAIDRFDLDRGVEFSTYAMPTIIGEMKRHFRDRAWSVRVPRDIQALAVRLPKEQERLTGKLGRTPTLAELAEALAVEPEQLVEAIDARQAYRAISFSSAAPAGEGEEDGDLLEQIGSEDRGYERCERRLALRAGIATLDERERRVLLLRFARDLTQSEIASQLGYSQMHISRILRGALDKLQAVVGDGSAAAPAAQ
jgi:RNA polymerase sigma-B factor